MGIVYAARDRVLDRRVALKVLDLTPAGEAQLIAALEHPAIVPVYEAGTLPDGREFYAMKLIRGASLDRYLAAEPTLAERLRLIWRVGEALAYAHSHGVIHRDLKPQNVMVGEFGEGRSPELPRSVPLKSFSISVPTSMLWEHCCGSYFPTPILLPSEQSQPRP